MQRHRCQAAALDGNDALMSVLAAALVHGEGQVARSQQRVRRRRGISDKQVFQQPGVRPGVAPQLPGVGAVGQQHVHRAVALGLQAERAAELERGGQAGRQRQRLPAKLRDDRVVVVPRQQRVGQRAQAHQPPPHRTPRQEERHHAARDDHVGHRGAANVEEHGGVCHVPRLAAYTPCRYRPINVRRSKPFVNPSCLCRRPRHRPRILRRYRAARQEPVPDARHNGTTGAAAGSRDRHRG